MTKLIVSLRHTLSDLVLLWTEPGCEPDWPVSKAATGKSMRFLHKPSRTAMEHTRRMRVRTAQLFLIPSYCRTNRPGLTERRGSPAKAA